MDSRLAQQIKERLEELPTDVRRAIQSAHVDKTVQEVGVKNSLHLDQIGILGDETYMVMLGFTEASEFTENLAKEANLSLDKAEAIAQDIGVKLFIPIRTSLQQFNEERAVAETLLTEKQKTEVSNISTPIKISLTSTAPTPPMPPKIMTPPTPPAAPKPAITPPPAPKLVEMHPADLMLTQKTVTAAPAAPKPASPTQPVTPPAAAPAATAPAATVPVAPKKEEGVQPKPYAADPYREPVE